MTTTKGYPMTGLACKLKVYKGYGVGTLVNPMSYIRHTKLGLV